MPIRVHGLGVVVCWKAPTVALPEGRKEGRKRRRSAGGRNCSRPAKTGTTSSAR